MMTMPTRTAAIAAHVGPATRSPSAAQASSAAISGALACTSRMLATVVNWSAMTKEVEALANSRATARPGSPIARRDATDPLAPSRQSTKPKRKTLAQTDRQKTIVHESIPSPSSRPKVPPKLQATAEPRISHAPARDSASGTGDVVSIAAARPAVRSGASPPAAPWASTHVR